MAWLGQTAVGEGVGEGKGRRKAALTNAGFEGIPNNQRCASRVPLPSKRRPWKLLGVWEFAIELCPCFGDCTTGVNSERSKEDSHCSYTPQDM